MKSFQGKSKGLRRYALPLLMISACGFVASEVMATHTVTETEDIRNTKHYMIGNPDVLARGATTFPPMSEVCVFCHTPHGANGATQALAPLWNRNLPDSGTYKEYNAVNFDRGGNTPGKPKGVSLACLSCHDGTIAVDALINAPGSGGFEKLNLGITGNISIPAIDFGGGIIDTDSSMRGGALPPDYRNGTETNLTSLSPYSGGIHDTITGVIGGASPIESAYPFPNLDIDLSDDHPIGMAVPDPRFCGGLCASFDPQFSLIGKNSSLDGGTAGSSVMFVTKDGQLATDKRDRIRLYPSDYPTNRYYVECASCHNPHTPRVSFLRLPSSIRKDIRTTGVIDNPLDYWHITGPTDTIDTAWSATDAGVTWGQKPNSGSAICLSCHQK
ncbi:MAG: hypothetical protein HY204_01560 [Nitrospirae bacterium]|nr:hypothetical protein [Nitrospirota bacterium]